MVTDEPCVILAAHHVPTIHPRDRERYRDGVTAGAMVNHHRVDQCHRTSIARQCIIVRGDGVGHRCVFVCSSVLDFVTCIMATKSDVYTVVHWPTHAVP